MLPSTIVPSSVAEHQFRSEKISGKKYFEDKNKKAGK